MDVKSGYPWWSVSNGLLSTWPELVDDTDAEIVVVGAGITGALIADSLMEAGHEVVLIDRRDVGMGSTSASTAMLQYELDTELQELAKIYDAQSAAQVYRACESAISDLESILDRLPGKADFKRNKSLYFASRHLHRRRLKREFETRREHGFDVELLDAKQLRDGYGIDSPIGLLTANAARIDPYKFTHLLLRNLAKRGAKIFDRSGMVDFTALPDHLSLRMESGARLRCQRLIIACGYESQQFLPRKVAKIRSSYALVTEPLDSLPMQLGDTLIWESARPYVYLRSTADKRILIGGEDDRIDIATKRDAAVPWKAEKLMRRLQGWLPDTPLRVGFAWGGTFAETDDGLPYIGPHHDLDPRLQFAMAYGGNGILYSVLAGPMLVDNIAGRRNPLEGLFGFER